MTDDTAVLMRMDLEYRLTVAHRINCWCSRYLIERREVLLPYFVRRYTEVGTGDPEDFVHESLLKLHTEKCPTEEQPENFTEMVVRRIRETMDDKPKNGVKSSPYPVKCSDCGSNVGEPCVSGCPNLDY